MHVSNVNQYAPPGYKLSGTAYDGSITRHTFEGPRGPLTCEVEATSRDVEVAALERFRELHTVRAPEPTPEPVSAPASSAKPRKRS